jgi:radical SAM protein with 4Fe4S-binding SPASM domain
VRRGIDLLRSRGLRLTLKAVAMEPLAGEIAAMESFCRDLGLPFRYDPIIHARLDGSPQPLAARSAPETVVGYDARDPARLAAWLGYYRQFVLPARPTTFLMSCGAGVESFHVDPQGTLSACEALPLEGYDLRRGPFREGWRGAVENLLRRRAAAENVCSACALRSLCDRCPATALLETGSPDGWVPYFCEVTHRRAALLEDRLGRPETAARYLARAERVASGWSPPGAILPRAGSGATSSCASGGCAAGSCGRSTSGRPVAPEPLLQIALPGTSPAPSASMESIA